MRTVAIINQKGGCGKTTSAINLAGMFAHAGRRTLLVDLDPQSHCAAGLAIPEQRVDLDVGDALIAGAVAEPRRMLWRACRNLDLLPSRMRLAGLESAAGGLAELPEREHRLRLVLSSLNEGYDACFVDCPPSIGLLTFNALVAADIVVIPVETSFFSLQGATRQLSTIKSLSRRLGRDIPTFILPTIHDASNALAEDLLDELRRRFGRQVLPRHIRSDYALREAASFGQPIVEYDPESPGALDYAAVAEMLAEHLGLPARPAQTPIFAPPAEPKPEPRPLAATEPPPPATPPLAQPEAPPVIDRPASAVEIATDAADLVARASAMRRALARLSSGRSQPHADEPRESPSARSTLAVVDTTPSPVHPSAKRLLGVTYTTHGVLFVQPLSLGRSLAIAGTFNGWAPAEHRMQRNTDLGIFEICIPIPPGRHSYRLVIDGRTETDPFNPVVEHTPDGNRASILDVPAAAPSRAPDPSVALAELDAAPADDTDTEDTPDLSVRTRTGEHASRHT